MSCGSGGEWCLVVGKRSESFLVLCFGFRKRCCKGQKTARHKYFVVWQGGKGNPGSNLSDPAEKCNPALSTMLFPVSSILLYLVYGFCNRALSTMLFPHSFILLYLLSAFCIQYTLHHP